MNYSNPEFFNSASEYYDEMIPFEQSVENKRKVFGQLLSNVGTAADIGCGTGADTIALSRLGFAVDAFDTSPKMIETAEARAERESGDFKFFRTPFFDTPAEARSPYNAIVSLGNTFANIRTAEIFYTVRAINLKLKPGGKCVIQIVNYAKVLMEKERILKTSESDKEIFVRFYDYHTNHIVFNILKIEKENVSKTSLISTKLYPHSAEFLLEQAAKSGFTKIALHGALDLSDYSPEKSPNVVLILEK